MKTEATTPCTYKCGATCPRTAPCEDCIHFAAYMRNTSRKTLAPLEVAIVKAAIAVQRSGKIRWRLDDLLPLLGNPAKRSDKTKSISYALKFLKRQEYVTVNPGKYIKYGLYSLTAKCSGYV